MGSTDRRNTSLLTLIFHLKNIKDDEDPENILDQAPINMPQRPTFPILGQRVKKEGHLQQREER